MPSVTALDSGEVPPTLLQKAPRQKWADGDASGPRTDSRGITQANVWEVVCTTCGDHGGLYRGQPQEIKVQRGPYVSEFEAREALRKHIERTTGGA